VKIGENMAVPASDHGQEMICLFCQLMRTKEFQRLVAQLCNLLVSQIPFFTDPLDFAADSGNRIVNMARLHYRPCVLLLRFIYLVRFAHQTVGNTKVNLRVSSQELQTFLQLVLGVAWVFFPPLCEDALFCWSVIHEDYCFPTF
jgi:hypothetical protein